jgi:signal transduction histidine kinase
MYLRRHLLAVAVPVLIFPLVIILVVQYRSLRAMEQSAPLQRKEVLTQFLKAVAGEVNEWYGARAKQALAVPADLLGRQEQGVILDDVAQSRAVAATQKVADHFQQNQFAGASRFFLVRETEVGGSPRSAILFFDPSSNRMISDPQARELRPINVAAAPYMIYARTRTQVQPEIMGIDRDPDCSLIIKPILDKEGIIIGLTGLVVDKKWLENEAVPQAIRNALDRHLPANDSGAMVTLRGMDQSVVYRLGPDAERESEASLPLGPLFWSYTLGVNLSNTGVAQWTRQNFTLNLSLSILMTLVLAGGLLFTLRAAAKEVKVSQMKSDFVANVSHELRTPLTSIRVFGELLKLGRIKDPQKVREFGAYIEFEGRRLTQLINNILDFSRIESGQKRYHFGRSDLGEVINTASAACAVRLEQTGRSLRIEAPDEPRPAVYIDFDALVMALINLLDNAIKYSGDAMEIVVRLAFVSDSATITVEDNGIGISQAEHERIFEKFYRVSTGLVHDIKGNGLGLSIVKHIVEAHEGRVTLQSELGRGSSFVIHLPLAGVAEPALAETSSVDAAIPDQLSTMRS